MDERDGFVRRATATDDRDQVGLWPWSLLDRHRLDIAVRLSADSQQHPEPFSERAQCISCRFESRDVEFGVVHTPRCNHDELVLRVTHDCDDAVRWAGAVGSPPTKTDS